MLPPCPPQLDSLKLRYTCLDDIHRRCTEGHPISLAGFGCARGDDPQVIGKGQLVEPHADDILLPLSCEQAQP